MNQGAVASRYGRAFLQFVEESGRGEQVFTQVRALLADPSSAPQPLEPALEKLVLLLRRNHRLDCLKLILHDFVRLWCKEHKVVLVKLVTAVPSPGLPERLEALIAARTGCKVIMATAIDPDILGGFMLELDNEMLDASVRRQIDDIRNQLVQKNNRII
ncbi:MAG: F0F1 ATP synthase subunit delta [Bacteroidales bacterium]|nr:F0F1 ATP synthase subunit delta [Bacteroidales bacterium]